MTPFSMSHQQTLAPNVVKFEYRTFIEIIFENHEKSGVVDVLNSVRAFHLNQFHLVVLEAKVDGVFKTHVAKTVLIGLVGKHGEEGLISAVTLCVLAIDDE